LSIHKKKKKAVKRKKVKPVSKAKPPSTGKNKKPIGTRNESNLHRTLKIQYAGPCGKTEIKTGEFITDGRKADGEYIEIQTSNFASLEKKVKEITKNDKLRIIHPVAVKKIIEVYEPPSVRKKQTGKLLYRRTSPVKGSRWNIFDALVYAPTLPLFRGLTIEIALVEIIEKRVKDGKGSWRRKGVSIKDKTLTCLQENIILKKPTDYRMFIPFAKKEEFTSSMLAQKSCIDMRTARKALYVLTKMKIVKRTGKLGNSWKYVRK
jgi:hypothetical protein